MKLEGQKFVNGETCRGVVYVAPGAPSDFAEITITGRYPEEGWAVNHEAHESVRVHRGVGALAVQGSSEVRLLQGDVVHVPPETPFVWSGDMILHMTCTPPFSTDQYEIIEEKS